MRLLAWVAFGAVVFLLGLIAVRLAPRGSQVAAWWPAAGVSVAVLARFWRSRWALAAVVVVFSCAANVVGGRPWAVSVGFGFSNAAEALVGAGCLWWLSRDGAPTLDRLSDVGRLLAAAVAGAVTIAAGVAVTLELFTDEHVDPALLNVIPSHSASVLLIVPLSLASPPAIRRSVIEVTGAWALTAGAVLLVFAPAQTLPLAFVVIGPLVWAATRLGVRATAAQLIFVGVAVTLLTARGAGPFAQTAVGGIGSNPLVQSFVVTCALLAVLLAVSTAERERAVGRVTASEELFRRGFQEALVGLALLRIEGGSVRAIEVNASAATTLDLRPGAIVTDRLRDDEGRPLGAIAAGLAPGTGWRGEMGHEHDPRGERRYEIAVSRLSGDESRTLVTCQVVDVTDRIRAEMELERLALRDHLTGLPNRLLLDRRLAAELATGQPVGLLFVDLDDFKLVNDTSGHRLGDQILVTVADRLAACIRPEDTVARMGGDEFVVVLPGLDSADDCLLIVDRIWAAFANPVEAGDLVYKVDLSIGVALSTAGSTGDELLSQADTALYSGKAAGKRRAVVYSDELGAAAADQVRLEAELHAAIGEGQFCLHMQPIVEMDSGRWMAAEALIRWRHPVRGLLGPEVFLHVAERAGMMPEIGRWVLSEACRLAADWIEEVGEVRSPAVHVNVSPRQLDRPGLSGEVMSALRLHHLPPSQLVLELTETHLAEIDDVVIAEFGALAAHGVRFAVDHYGTGHSPLTRITELPIDMIKVDREFVRSVTSDRRAFAVVASLEELARTIGLRIVAEGVEEMETALTLQEIGIELGQGRLWQQALPSLVFREMLAANTAISRDHPGRSGPLTRGDLAAAISCGELRVLFQPLVMARSRVCSSVEALVRWQHPTKGMIPPLEFIPMAEASGLIGPLTERVLEESLRECARWNAGGDRLSVSVNFSPVLLDDPRWPHRVAAMLATHGLPAEALTLEITESALADPTPEATLMLAEMRQLEIRLSVDDFGTGYTSLGLLRQFEFDELKIDGSFVSDMLKSPADAAIVRSMLELGHRLGLTVVAECVPDEATAQALGLLGCDVLQGYFFSRPVASEELSETLGRLRAERSAPVLGLSSGAGRRGAR